MNLKKEESFRDIDHKLKNTFSLIKKDIDKVSKKVSLASFVNKEQEILLQDRLNQLNVILSSLDTLKQKFAIEVKRYKEETRLLRELIKNLDRRVRDIEMAKEMDEDTGKFWASWSKPLDSN